MIKPFIHKNKRKLSIGGVIFLALAIVIVIPVIVVYSRNSDSDKNEPAKQNFKKPFDLNKLAPNEKDRINCFLEAESKFENLTKYQCETVRKCIFLESEYERVPDCFFNRKILGYKLKELKGKNKYLLEGDAAHSPYLGFIKNVLLETSYHGNNIVRVKITDNDNERYEVPYPLNLPNQIDDWTKNAAEFKFEEDLNSMSSFQILRRGTNDILFDTTEGGFVFTDQFIQISTNLINGSAVYGFGENNHESLKHDINYRSWGMFARDNAPGWGDNRNNYGFQPVYFTMEPRTGKCHLVLLYNSNAMEHLFTPKPSLTFRTIGGILDFYFIVDDTPEKVISHYHNLIGLPMFPPYWSLGFQISRWGYKNLQEVKDVVARTKSINLPHDVQYIDIDYMIGYRILTIDKEDFNGTREFQKELRKNGQRFVLIVDPGLVMEPNNTLYVNGLNDDVYVKWPINLAPYDIDSKNNNDMISLCWPKGKLSYPDYLNEKTHTWWKKQVKNFIESEKDGSDMDGLWIDMNEPSSFETNELKPWNWLYPENDQDKYPYFTLKCPINKLDDPPYRTKSAFAFDDGNLLASNKKARLSQKTLCMIALHKKDGKEYYHYDVHNLYGHAQSIASYNAMLNAKPGLRPFVLTRSNFVGSGKYTTHWLGDNDSTWKHMKMSIIGLIEYNIFGFPYIGADICGFFIDIQDAEMCTRWLQLGAFYTFSRSHNANQNIEKDPASFKNKILEDSTREALKIRYSILPFIYTLLYKVNKNGGTVLRPLSFEFPTDPETFEIDEQFLIGSSFLVSPVLKPKKTTVNAYFPEARWYDFRKGHLIEKNGWSSLNAPINYINLHLRGGSIIPIQDPKECLNTECSRKKPFGLIVTLDKSNKANGELWWDDGVSLINELMPNFSFMEFTYQNDMLSMFVKTQGTNDEKLNFETIKIYGLEKNVFNVIVSPSNQKKFDFDQENKVLTIKDLNLPMDKNFSIELKFTENRNN